MSQSSASASSVRSAIMSPICGRLRRALSASRTATAASVRPAMPSTSRLATSSPTAPRPAMPDPQIFLPRSFLAFRPVKYRLSLFQEGAHAFGKVRRRCRLARCNSYSSASCASRSLPVEASSALLHQAERDGRRLGEARAHRLRFAHQRVVVEHFPDQAPFRGLLGGIGLRRSSPGRGRAPCRPGAAECMCRRYRE